MDLDKKSFILCLNLVCEYLLYVYFPPKKGIIMKNFSANIKYIGVDDKDIDLFEGQYVVPAGMAYNSYVIVDEKIAVTDTVDAHKVGEWLANLETALAGRKPDYLVIHHIILTSFCKRIYM